MEKVEKLLLLVVLGAAMVIMAVMSFGSSDPEKPGKTGPGIQQAKTDGNGDNESTLMDPGVGENQADAGKGEAEKRSVDQLNLKIQDGPDLLSLEAGLGKQGKPGEQALGKKIDGPGSDGMGSEGQVLDGNGLNGPGGQGRTAVPGMDGTSEVVTAELALVPGDEPGILIYTVQPNDSLSGIMERLTGSTRNVSEIIAGWNEGMDRNVIVPGQKIQIPESMIKSRTRSPGVRAAPAVAKRSGRLPVPGMIPAPAAKSVPTPSPRAERTTVPKTGAAPRAPRTESYTIKKGETLWAIARSRVGDRGANAYVRRIQVLNPGVEPSDLRPKDVIQLPAR